MALVVMKTQECNIGVREDGLYTMDTRPKKASTSLHKDIVADVKFPSGCVIIKKKGSEYVLHVNTCTTIRPTPDIHANGSPWLCSISSENMSNNVYGYIIGKRMPIDNSGIVVKFDAGSVQVEESAGKYIVTTSTTVIEEKKGSCRKRPAPASASVPQAKVASLEYETVPSEEFIPTTTTPSTLQHETVSCTGTFTTPPQITLDEILGSTFAPYVGGQQQNIMLVPYSESQTQAV